jgi:hypothetical protein
VLKLNKTEGYKCGDKVIIKNGAKELLESKGWVSPDMPCREGEEGKVTYSFTLVGIGHIGVIFKDGYENVYFPDCLLRVS